MSANDTHNSQSEYVRPLTVRTKKNRTALLATRQRLTDHLESLVPVDLAITTTTTTARVIQNYMPAMSLFQNHAPAPPLSPDFIDNPLFTQYGLSSATLDQFVPGFNTVRKFLIKRAGIDSTRVAAYVSINVRTIDSKK